jgi:hypothetical protein
MRFVKCIKLPVSGQIGWFMYENLRIVRQPPSVNFWADFMQANKGVPAYSITFLNCNAEYIFWPNEPCLALKKDYLQQNSKKI